MSGIIKNSVYPFAQTDELLATFRSILDFAKKKYAARSVQKQRFPEDLTIFLAKLAVPKNEILDPANIRETYLYHEKTEHLLLYVTKSQYTIENPMSPLY